MGCIWPAGCSLYATAVKVLGLYFIFAFQADRERTDGSVFIYPYDLGTWNNIKQVNSKINFVFMFLIQQLNSMHFT